MSGSDRSVSYGRYVLKLAPSADTWRGLAYRGDVAVGEQVREPSRDEAVAALKAQIAAVEKEYRDVRQRDGFPSASEVHLALKQIKITRGQEAMLQAHLKAPDMCLTATELAAAAGSAHYETANSQYGKLGKALAEELDWTPPPFDGLVTWTFALATGVNDVGTAIDEAELESQNWRWRLRPQVAEAVAMRDAARR